MAELVDALDSKPSLRVRVRFPPGILNLNNSIPMALDFGYEPEPWMNSDAHNRHSSRKEIKRFRNRKLRRIPVGEDVRSLLKKFTGWEW